MACLRRDADLLPEQLAPQRKIAWPGWLCEEQEIAPVEGRVGGGADHQIVAAVGDLAVEGVEDQICAIA